MCDAKRKQQVDHDFIRLSGNRWVTWFGYKKSNQKKLRLTDQEGFNPLSNTGKYTFFF